MMTSADLSFTVCFVIAVLGLTICSYFKHKYNKDKD